MEKTNLPLLVFGLMLILIGCMMLDTWPEPVVFEPVGVSEVVEDEYDPLTAVRASCLILKDSYMSLYNSIHDSTVGSLSHDAGVLGLKYLVAGHTQYVLACSFKDVTAGPIPEPTLPLHLTI